MTIETVIIIGALAVLINVVATVIRYDRITPAPSAIVPTQPVKATMSRKSTKGGKKK